MKTDPPTDTLVRAARLDGAYRILLELAPLDGFLASSTTRALTVRLHFPDTERYTDCSHPGMADDYYVDVALEFDDKGALVKSSVSAMQVSLGPT